MASPLFLPEDGQTPSPPVFTPAERAAASTAIYTRDVVYVQLRRREEVAHGDVLIDVGEPIEVRCSVEGRAQQAGMFSISGAEDKTVGTAGGLQEVTPIQIMALDWPGDIDSLIWFMGDKYDADGSPIWRAHGRIPHWEIRARRVWAHGFSVALQPGEADHGVRTV